MEKYSKLNNPKLLIVLIMLVLPHFALAAPLNPTDDAALVALYNTTNGASWTNSTGWSGTVGVMDTANPPYGVTFDGITDRVTALSLRHNNLNGLAPNIDLSGTTSLIDLDLDGNALGGSPIPPSQLPAGIQKFLMQQNLLSGAMPDYSGLLSLTWIGLSNNQIPGPLPTSATLPVVLTTLWLAANSFTGDIPNYASLANLTSLNLSQNLGLTSGAVPLASQLPPLLQSLNLRETNRTGPIPDYSSMNSLFVLNLANNQLTGSIPDYSANTSMINLALNNNSLTGALPPAIQLPSGLRFLQLGTNLLTGAIPDYRTLASLQFLSLSWNMLSGSLPPASQLPATLQTLEAKTTQLSGTVPDYSSLSSLIRLDISVNQLTGALPLPAQLPTGLKWLFLNNNQLSGVVPDYSTIGSLSLLSLGVMDIQGPTPAGLLAWGGTATFTTTPSIDPALDGNSYQAEPVMVTGFGGELGGTVELLLDNITITTGIVTGGIGDWSGWVDLTGKAEGTYTVTAISRFDNWPGHVPGEPSEVFSNAVSLVVDQTVPVITLLGSATETVELGLSYTDPGSMVSDNVDINLTASMSGIVDTATLGSYTLNYNVTDSAGNPAIQVTRTVNVVDTTAPVITVPSDITVAATSSTGISSSDSAIMAFLANITATDNDQVALITHDAPALLPVGDSLITFTASDATGNNATASATVTVTEFIPVTAPITGSRGGGSIGLGLILTLAFLLMITNRSRVHVTVGRSRVVGLTQSRKSSR